jgi:spore coat polysaccharide biosynthesis protein SpsF
VAETVDQIVVAVGDRPENKAIVEYCERANTEYIVGPEDDLLSRHLSVVEKTDCDVLVRITADCPFVPSEEIDRVVKEHSTNDAQYTTSTKDETPIGLAVDVIDPSMLKKLESVGETHPVKKARSHPDEWGTRWSQNPSWCDLSDVHMAVDTPEDYWSLFDAVDAVGDDPKAVAEWLNE